MSIKFISCTANPRELCVACAREAYQSHHLSTPESDGKLLKFLLDHGHRSITEFARATLVIRENPKVLIEFLSGTKGWELSLSGDEYVLTLNPRTVYDGLQFSTLAGRIYNELPDEFRELILINKAPLLGQIKYPRTTVDIWDTYLPDVMEQEKHSFQVVRITGTRGLMDELFRHRLGAMVGSSTRRVDFSDFQLSPPGDEKWIELTKQLYAQSKKTEGLDFARRYLPLGMKCSFVYGTSLRHWKYIKNLRLSSSAHPEFKDLLTF